MGIGRRFGYVGRLGSATSGGLDGPSPEEQFRLLSNRINGIQDPTRKAAIG